MIREPGLNASVILSWIAMNYTVPIKLYTEGKKSFP